METKVETVKECGNNYVKQENCEMSQIRRKSTGSKGNTSQALLKNQITEVTNEEKSLDKQETSTGAKSTKVTGVPQTTTRQLSIKEQLKPRPKFTKSNKRTRDKDNLSPQKSPPKKRMNSERRAGGVNPTDPKQTELNPDHEELKRQIFTGIKLMLDLIKEDIEQIKLDQCGLKNDTDSCTVK